MRDIVHIDTYIFMQAIVLVVLLAIFFRIYLAVRRFLQRNRQDPGARLHQLDTLLHNGSISADEHARQRAAIIAQL
jgi:uncharacterized membrane protein